MDTVKDWSKIITDWSKASLIASIEAYEEKPLEDYNLGGFIPTKKYNIAGIQFLIGQFGSATMIVFRGSDEFIDFIRDADMRKRVIPYGGVNPKIKVHKGFITAYKAVRKTIHEYLYEAKPEDILVTGHSMGGALATLCAVDLDYCFNDDADIDITCYVFGCPKVGNKAFRESYNDRIYDHIRIVNGSDIVPHLPRWWQGYRHVGIKYLYGKHTAIFYWNLIKKGRILTALKTFLIGTINDHFSKSYLSIVDEL